MATTTHTAAPATAARPGRRLSGLTLAILVIALIGLADASYLTVVHYEGFKLLACVGEHSGHSSCETVQSSIWSKVGGVPVAVLGVAGYVAILASLLVRNDLGRAMAFGVALIGFAFSAYLTYRELFSIHAICEWCVGSAVCMTVLVILTAIRFLRGDPLPAA